jgi:hypothetical protein
LHIHRVIFRNGGSSLNGEMNAICICSENLQAILLIKNKDIQQEV